MAHRLWLVISLVVSASIAFQNSQLLAQTKITVGIAAMSPRTILPSDCAGARTVRQARDSDAHRPC